MYVNVATCFRLKFYQNSGSAKCAIVRTAHYSIVLRNQNPNIRCHPPLYIYHQWLLPVMHASPYRHWHSGQKLEWQQPFHIYFPPQLQVIYMPRMWCLAHCFSSSWQISLSKGNPHPHFFQSVTCAHLSMLFNLIDGFFWMWAAVLVYEYFLTLLLEVERFWSAKRLSWSMFLFFLNRYLTLVGHIPLTVEYLFYSTSPSKLTVSLVVPAEVEFPCNPSVE